MHTYESADRRGTETGQIDNYGMLSSSVCLCFMHVLLLALRLARQIDWYSLRMTIYIYKCFLQRLSSFFQTQEKSIIMLVQISIVIVILACFECKPIIVRNITGRKQTNVHEINESYLYIISCHC
jgi:hypothetical protein